MNRQIESPLIRCLDELRELTQRLTSVAGLELYYVMPSRREKPLRICFPPDELNSPETRCIEARAHAKIALQRSEGILAASDKLNIRVDHLLAGLSNAILFLAREQEQKPTGA